MCRLIVLSSRVLTWSCEWFGDVVPLFCVCSAGVYSPAACNLLLELLHQFLSGEGDVDHWSLGLYTSDSVSLVLPLTCQFHVCHQCTRCAALSINHSCNAWGVWNFCCVFLQWKFHNLYNLIYRHGDINAQMSQRMSILYMHACVLTSHRSGSLAFVHTGHVLV